jgi:hypothetical protein
MNVTEQKKIRRMNAFFVYGEWSTSAISGGSGCTQSTATAATWKSDVLYQPKKFKNGLTGLKNKYTRKLLKMVTWYNLHVLQIDPSCS